MAGRALALTAAVLGAALSAAATGAQVPGDDWRTLETDHFRLHFRAGAEAWSARLGARLEAVRAAVAAEAGYEPPQTIDVVVADPDAQANGSAWPLLGSPRMALWTTPPAAASTLGQVADWGELVLVHEYAHLAHLLRPSRHPLRSRLEPWALPLGPLALGAPRWAVEGYATLLEGRLTGSGRPHSAFRAAVLRQWGAQGRLPSYGRLSSDREGFLGLSMAYLGGSAFLEWLERRPAVVAASGEDRPLPRLWAAATARSGRDFDAAFARVFGERPAQAWARFCAETTAAAIERERQLAGVERAGEVWIDRDGATDELSIAADGGRLAALVTDRRRPTRLVVWELSATPEESEPATGQAALDPEDPPALARPPRARHAAATLEPAPGSTLLGARFLGAGEELLVGLLRPDRRGFRRAEIGLWRPGGRLRPVARDVRDADPLPDGRRAIGVRWREGRSALVEVDLATGAVRELATPSLELVHDRPRVAPGGGELAWLEHRAGRWGARVAPLVDGVGGRSLGAPRTIAPAAGGEPLDLAWRGDGSLLYAAVARGDSLEIEALPVAGAAREHQVTRGLGAALSPAPTPDGRTLFYLALDADGFDVRRLALDAATLQVDPPPAPATAGVEPLPFTDAETSPSRAYGAGRPEWRPLAAGWWGDSDGALELGVRAGELLGRWEALALGADAGDEGPRGGALRLAIRPSAGTLSLALAGYEEHGEPTRAAELALRRESWWGPLRLDATAGAGWARRRAEGSPAFERGSGFVELALRRGFRRGRLRLDPGLAADYALGFGDSEARHERLAAELAATGPRLALTLGWERRRARGELGPGEALALGGFPSSVAPRSARPGRVDHPALEPATLTGLEHEVQRLRAGTAGLPVALLLERHRVDRGDWLRLWGLEARLRTPPMPFAGVPALQAAAGVARLEAAAGGGETRIWVGLVFPLRPGAVGPPLGTAALDSAP